MEWIKYVAPILAGIATAIPLIIKLIEYSQKAVKEKNWSELLRLVMSLMEEAERKFSDGETRKDWVMKSVKAASDTVNYDINMDTVATLIDSLCDLSKIVNSKDIPDKNEEECDV